MPKSDTPDAAVLSRCREIALKVWRGQGWGSEPEYSEGELCISSVEAGYRAALQDERERLVREFEKRYCTCAETGTTTCWEILQWLKNR